MTAIALLDTLHTRGVSIRVEGQDLKLRPAGALDDDLLHEVRSLKPQLVELVKLLSNEPTGPAVQLLRETAKRHQWPGIPGVVRMSSELVDLWEAAEIEAGHPLTVNGKPRGHRDE